MHFHSKISCNFNAATVPSLRAVARFGKHLLLSAVLVFAFAGAFAQEIKNLNFKQNSQDNTIEITYDLTDANAEQLYEVRVFCSTDGGQNFSDALRNLQGDAGQDIQPGSRKKIIWDAATEWGELTQVAVQFKLQAVPQYSYENMAWDKAKEQNTYEAYTEFLRRYPNGEHAYTAQQNKERLCRHDSFPGTSNMIYVKGGTFKMGSNEYDNEYLHSVTVSDFYIGKYEVTHAEYIKFLNKKGVKSNGSYGSTEYIDMDDSDCAIGHNGSF
ncbi:MAG: SUMF1/EgtB/PvdO family nonheme iron enzyme, partial [Bacteroidota bacterium]|nr:SUMF1/EgtB/PvdO family nonheme iron enzyme [Bacteroidota bacterium]